MQSPELFACLSKERKENLLGTLLFRPSIYERLYYEEEIVRKQIVCYEEFLQIVRNPQIRAAAPEIDFEFEEFSANSYLSITDRDYADFAEFMKGKKVPYESDTRRALKVLKKAAEDALAYARENKNFRQNEETLLGTLHTIQGYLGEISISEMLDTYVNWLNGADPTQYDWMNVENNLLPVLYTFWLCEARPEWTDTCRLFLLEGQRKSFEYIKNSRDKGAYECMQRFTSYIMNSYIELDGGIPFRHYYEKFARSLFNEEFDLIRLPRCGNRFRRTCLQLQQKFCRYARRSPLQRRPYVQPESRTALCFQDFLPSSHQQNNTLMRIT